MPEISKPFTIIDSHYVVSVYILCFLFLALFLKNENYSFLRLINVFDKGTTNAVSPFWKIVTTTISMVGFFMFFATVFWNNIQSKLIENSLINHSTLLFWFGFFVAVVLVFFVYNVLVFGVIKYIFDIKLSILKRINILNSVISVGTLCLFLSFVVSFVAMPQSILIAVGVVVISILVVKFIFEVMRFFLSFSVFDFHFFLYLCILEILPILILIKYISKQIN